MTDKQTLTTLLKKCSELGYSLIEVVGEFEAARIYGLAVAEETKSKPS